VEAEFNQASVSQSSGIPPWIGDLCGFIEMEKRLWHNMFGLLFAAL
jgi:hypothetical protein